MVVKPCIKCGERKALSEFYPHAKMADGHLNQCKECSKRLARGWRLLKLAECRAYDRRRSSQAHRVTARQIYRQTDAYKIASAEAKRRWAKLNPKKKRATQTVYNAIRDGKLMREPCFVCGAAAEAHHADYDAPLHVTWLCDAHHKQVHKEAREYERQAA